MAFLNKDERDAWQNREFLKAMGLSRWKQLLNKADVGLIFSGPALSIDEITERYLQFNPDTTVEQAKEAVPQLLTKTYNPWPYEPYQFEHVINPDTEQRKYRVIKEPRHFSYGL